MSTNQNTTKLTDTILIVDDETDSLRLLTDILSSEGYRVRPMERPQSAIESAMADPPSLILLDVKMPEVGGFEVSRQLKQDERTKDIPIIFVSGLQDTEDSIQGFEAGGVDFISKPFQEAEILARVKTHLQLYRMQMRLEDLVSERKAELTQTNEALQIEIAERKQAEEAYQASQRLLSLVIDNVPALVAYVDRHRHYRFVNQRYEKLYGRPQAHFVGKHVQEILGPEGYAAAEQNIAAALVGDEMSYEEVFNYPGGEQRWMEVHYVPDRGFSGDVKGLIALIQDVTDRKRAEQKLIDYQQRLKTLVFQLTIAEEKERHRIAQSLHDHISQSLALARIQIASARDSVSDQELADKLDDISNTLFEILEDTDQIMFELSSPIADEISFSAGISEWLEEQLGQRHGLKTEFIDNIMESRGELQDKNVMAILFRNVKELLVNVVKHARANRVSVRLENENSSVKVFVEDDGIGFDPLKVNREGSQIGGFGLFSIEERMADLGGSFKIVSEPGKGCTAIVCLPLGLDNNQERNSQWL